MPKELEVHDRSGAAYLLRVRPYKGQENRINGAVLALTALPTQKALDS